MYCQKIHSVFLSVQDRKPIFLTRILHLPYRQAVISPEDPLSKSLIYMPNCSLVKVVVSPLHHTDKRQKCKCSLSQSEESVYFISLSATENTEKHVHTTPNH